MRKSALIAAAVLAAAALAAPAASADDGRRDSRLYEITITNVTRGEVITPPIAIVHDSGYHLFTPGMPASPELASLAEEGDTAPLQAALATNPGVGDVAMAGGALMPGHSVTLMVRATRRAHALTVAGMLATSNDAFFAVSGVKLSGRSHEAAVAWDAGSEGNSESCSEIPGPPCGSHNVRNTATAEGFVHVHSGIHGIGDLDAAQFDWRNPVAIVSVRAVRN